MLVICAEAGLASDAALKRVVAETGRNASALSEELNQTALELSFMPQRRQALENFAERAPLPSVNAFVNTMIQAEKYGTPLARAFKVLSQEQRTERMLRAEEKAGRLPATMTVPMMIFILPALFIVLIGPAILDIMDNFIGHREVARPGYCGPRRRGWPAATSPATRRRPACPGRRRSNPRVVPSRRKPVSVAAGCGTLAAAIAEAARRAGSSSPGRRQRRWPAAGPPGASDAIAGSGAGGGRRALGSCWPAPRRRGGRGRRARSSVIGLPLQQQAAQLAVVGEIALDLRRAEVARQRRRRLALAAGEAVDQRQVAAGVGVGLPGRATRSRRMVMPSAVCPDRPSDSPRLLRSAKSVGSRFSPCAIGRLRLGVPAQPVERDPARGQQRDVVRPALAARCRGWPAPPAVCPAPSWVRASSSSTVGSFGRRRFASFSACSARLYWPMPA